MGAAKLSLLSPHCNVRWNQKEGVQTRWQRRLATEASLPAAYAQRAESPHLAACPRGLSQADDNDQATQTTGMHECSAPAHAQKPAP
eukprot:49102-Chlamydomonas_euryale.AAC.3